MSSGSESAPPRPPSGPGPLRLSSCEVDLVAFEVLHPDGRVEPLTDKQAGLLEYLSRHTDRVVSRDELHQRVWGHAPGVVTRAADTAVAELRRKVEVDPAHPEHVLTVFGEGYRFVPAEGGPATRPTRTNLPAGREPFVGRGRELSALTDMLSVPGWCTLVGPPGVGKTRLARAVARELVPRLDGGAWFCDLSEATDRVGVVQAIAHALGLPRASDGSVDAAVARLGRVVTHRGPLLLVLDNAEQVTEACARVCEALRDASSLRLLVTSRQALGGQGEEPVQVEPPELDQAVEVFAALAARARPGFEVDVGLRPQVEDLVQRLDRLPLALALAAARLSAMSVSDLLRRVHHRFRLLKDPRRDAVDRQRTLRAALDWSWETLDLVERGALAACGAFRGGFAADDAVAVVGGADTVEVLDALVARSLLTVEDGRYGMLASIREYAAEKLAMEPDREAEVLARHGQQYARLVPEDRALAFGSGLDERANLRAALRRAVTRGDATTATATAAALAHGYELTGPLDSGLAVVEEALGLQAASPGQRAMLQLWRGVLWWRSGRGDEAEGALRAAVEGLEAAGDPARAVQARSALGGLLQERGRLEEARQHHEAVLAWAARVGEVHGRASALSRLASLDELCDRLDDALCHYDGALALHRQAQDRRGEAIVSGNLAGLLQKLGRVDDARSLFEAALVAHGETEDRRGQAIVRGSLGTLHHEQGRLDDAREHLRAALALAREIGDRRLEGVVVGSLASVYQQEGRLDQARAAFEAALVLCREVHNPRSACVVLQNLGGAALEAGDLDEAAARFTEALRLAVQLDSRLLRGTALRRLGRVALLQTELTAALEHLEAAEVQLREVGHTLELGKLCCNRAELALAEGDPALARSALAEASSLLDQLGGGPDSELGADVARVRALYSGKSAPGPP